MRFTAHARREMRADGISPGTVRAVVAGGEARAGRCGRTIFSLHGVSAVVNVRCGVVVTAWRVRGQTRKRRRTG